MCKSKQEPRNQDRRTMFERGYAKAFESGFAVRFPAWRKKNMGPADVNRRCSKRRQVWLFAKGKAS